MEEKRRIIPAHVNRHEGEWAVVFCDTIRSHLSIYSRCTETYMFDLPDPEILPLSKEHVFWTWSAQANVNPIAVKRAQGVYFWDEDDKRYLDFNSITMCVNIGPGNER